MSQTWLSIRVDLVSGGGEDFWPRPGRIFAASPRHTFEQLATAIDDAFARWDRCHLHQFDLGDGRPIGEPDPDDEFELLDAAVVSLDRLVAGQQFVYVFDLGDCWTHLCTVGGIRIDPIEAVGVVPDRPVPYWGWGSIPDQYGRRWDSDDGESPAPPDPQLSDLPPLQPGWGANSRRVRSSNM
ncbi:hypothetical protein IU479_26920 [Nocardia abscessus]|uniref:IS1096 element passenger TnpR family protein n=1 Tax=Nocardia abscessus TaxID=120957 RepID=UPI0018960831|nr:hypothetical protein [Nocardia abscessus]MBF6221737.1 hypothetical protein [Nocardia abscessus]